MTFTLNMHLFHLLIAGAAAVGLRPAATAAAPAVGIIGGDGKVVTDKIPRDLELIKQPGENEADVFMNSYVRLMQANGYKPTKKLGEGGQGGIL